MRNVAQEGVKVHVRFLLLPPLYELSKTTISDIRSGDVSSLIQVTGTIVRTGSVRMLEESKTYECLNPRCKNRFTVHADIELDNMLAQPRVCMGINCKSTNIQEVEGGRVCVDYQEIKLQDHIERLDMGSVPRSLVVILKADLVDKVIVFFLSM